MLAHTHVWIDPNDPPMERAPYSPRIGPLRREMKFGVTYRCRVCFMTIKPMPIVEPADGERDARL